MSTPQCDNRVEDQGLEKLLVYFRGLLLDLIIVEHARFILERSTGLTKRYALWEMLVLEPHTEKGKFVKDL